MSIKLSILVPSTHTRYKTFLPKIQDQLYGQYNLLSEQDMSRVEILILSDTKLMCLGEKRNKMIDISQGEYVVFVDDDDRIATDYITTLLEACNSGADVITFKAMVSLNGGKPLPCYYSKDNLKDFNKPDGYYRIPNHICCVKKEVSLKSSFPNILRGEDALYAKVLLPHLVTEHKINKVLYYYDYNSATTETQMKRSASIRRRQQLPIVDIIVLSSATNSALRVMTQKTIDTCIAGANSLPVNVIVLEQQPNINYNNAKTIHQKEDFNYNRFCNIGAREGSAEWVMFINNDLIFTSGWLHSLLEANHPVMSPKCLYDRRQKDIEVNTIGDDCGRHLSGWAIFMKREIWKRIGGLPEIVSYWFSDNALIKEVNKTGISPMIVPSSVVNHLGSVTLKIQSTERRNELTWAQCYIYNKHYNDKLFENSPSYQKWKKKNNK